MEETTTYPTIKPSNFDLIVVGTGLPESIVAAAASAAGKTVVQLDPNALYGTHYASLPLQEFITFIQSHQPQSDASPTLQVTQSEDNTEDYISVPIVTRPLYSSLEINSYSSERLDDSRRFSLDLAGPRVLFCADPMINLVLKTGINQYMEFKSVDASFMSDAEGNLGTVPDSRSAIFKDRSLSFTEKNHLMKFFKLVQGHFLSESGGDDSDRISEEDLESPFVKFLTKLGLSQKLKSVILYAIVMANYDQDNMEVCKDVIKTKDAISRLTLYHSSIGRFPNANGAMIYPLYGQGELPQAFCRRAAVKGCIQVLRMPIIALLVDKDNRTYKGVKLASGQELISPQLILAPSFAITSHLAPGSSHALSSHDTKDAKEKIARGICITESSLTRGVANCLVFFPPRSLCPDQMMSVRVFQLSSNVAVCPSGMFVTYLSAACDSAVEGKKILHSVINALFSIPISGDSENTKLGDQSETTEVKPSLLWSAFYVQDSTMFQDAFESVNHMKMPDEHLHYDSLLDATEELFQKMYPGEEFFPKTNPSDEFPDEAVSDLET